MIHITNYDKLIYEGVKLTVDAPNQTIQVVEDDSTLKDLDPIKWEYGHAKCLSLFNRYTIGDDYRTRVVASHNKWKIKDDSVDIFKQQERMNKLLELIDGEYDVVICTPTLFKINQDFYDAVLKQVKCKWKITEIFFNANIQDVDDCVDYCRLVDDGDEEGCDEIYFSLFKRVKYYEDREHIMFCPNDIEYKYRKYIKHKVTKSGRYCDLLYVIDNKRILILDDTILADRQFSNLDISMSVRSLLDIYQPKSVTIATLFAPISSKDNENNKPLKVYGSFKIPSINEFEQDDDFMDSERAYYRFQKDRIF